MYASRVQVLDGAFECISDGNIPGGLKANREFAECVVGYEQAIREELKTLLFDPQTAGGLLISVGPEDASELLRSLNAAGVPAVEIGDRKSTRLNSSHRCISYAVFCLKKKNICNL